MGLSAGKGRTNIIEPEDNGWIKLLEPWGFDSQFQDDWHSFAASGVPARIIADHGESYTALTVTSEGRVASGVAVLAGKFRHQVTDRSGWPQVGDFVAVDRLDSGMRIAAVMPRRTALVRKNPGGSTEVQVMAANIDMVFILASLNQALNTARIERSLVLAWDSGAMPIILLTKADLTDDVGQFVDEAKDIFLGVPLIPISVKTQTGLDSVRPFLKPGSTAALLGPSGVGKSTLINYWLGEGRQKVQAIREDDGRGRHTTTHREMFQIPGGALIIDIPGVRELGVWEGGTGSVFADVEEWGQSCRFTDCQHAGEPGCAVGGAIARGELALEHLEQYRKMEREFQFVERKRSARARGEARQIWKQRSREARQRTKIK